MIESRIGSPNAALNGVCSIVFRLSPVDSIAIEQIHDVHHKNNLTIISEF